MLLVEIFPEFEDGHDIVGHRHLAEDRGLLGEVTHTHLRTLVHGILGKLDDFAGLALVLLGGEVDFSAIGLDNANDHMERGSLAGAVRTQKTNDFALANFHGSPLYNGTGAVFLDNVIGVETHKG